MGYKAAMSAGGISAYNKSIN